jgi:hypothetical protein
MAPLLRWTFLSPFCPGSVQEKNELAHEVTRIILGSYFSGFQSEM